MGDDYFGLFSGDNAGATAVGVPSLYNPNALLPGDVSDAQQMAPYNTAPAPQGQQQPPWWAGLAMYGVTKAIDNQFPTSPTGLYGNVYPGSAAGLNGRTYTLRPIGVGGGVQGASASMSLAGNPVLLLAAAAVAFLLLK